MMSGSSFQEHRVMLCLSKELYSAFIRLQADKGLGRSYAGLLPFVEGMHHLGYLNEMDYQAHLKRYSEPLVQPKPLTKEQLEEQRKLRELEIQFQGVLKTGLNKLSERSRKHWIKRAQEYQGKVLSARLLLDLANDGKGEDTS